jgi:uncharacterized membrane protein SpoIIM required for sporulation
MVLRFFVRDWPRAVRALWRETVVSAGIFVLAAAVAFMLVMRDVTYFNSFLPPALAQGRTPETPTKLLNDALHHGGWADALATFASVLFTHNSQVALSVFALGVMCCIPSALMLAQNGVGLGALAAAYVRHGLGVDFFGWILIHGVTEISAIILAAAAGFRLGWTVLFPGERSRLAALRAEGQLAATVMAGVVVMLLVAGLLEGLGRQLIQVTWARYGVAGATALGWALYFYGPWTGRHERD